MVQNPNWPVIDLAWCPSAGPSQSPQQPYWCSLAERAEGTVNIKRGKTYELDQVQSLEGSITLRNDDGAFDAGNTSSVYNGWVIPYRLFRARAQWPAAANLLTQNQATAGEGDAVPAKCEQPLAAGASIPAGANATSAWPLSIVNEGANAYQGSQVWSTAVPASQSSAFPYVLALQGVSVAPGQAYSAQFHARCITAGVNPSVKATIGWFDPSGNAISYGGTSVNVTLTGSATAGWTQVTVTNAVAPANAAGMQVILWENTPGPAAAHTIEVDGNQVEKGTTCSAWTRPGVWYPLGTGYLERWPQQWSSGGNYGTVTCPIVDLFAFLSQHELLGAFKLDLLALNPNFLYALDEASGTTAFADLTGKRGTAFVKPTALANTLVAGQSLQSGDNAPPGPDGVTALTGAFLGAPGPVVHTDLPTNPNGSPALGGGALLIPPDPNTGKVGPPTSGGWTRLVAARATNAPLANTYAFLWAFSDPTGPTNGASASIGWSNGNLTMFGNIESSSSNYGFANFTNLPALAKVVNNTLTMVDTDWHLYGISLSADGKTMNVWCDSMGGVSPQTTTTPMSPGQGSPGAGWTDCVGASASGNTTGWNWRGDIAFVCELPFEMSQNQWRGLWSSWRNGDGTAPTMLGVTSDARYNEILSWAGYTGPSRISLGLSTSVGPATDVAQQTALTALQNVVDTEGGQHFIGADGAVVFQSRADRYDQASAATFGENSGETPYTDATIDFDPTRVANDIQVTQTFGNALFRKQDSTSQSKYGSITLSRNVNSTDPNELTAAAQALLYWYKDPLPRLESLPFDVARQGSAAWPVMLARELGDAVTFNRRPPNAPAISIPGFVEQIEWNITDAVTADVNMQITNGAKHLVWKVEDATYGHFDQYPVAY